MPHVIRIENAGPDRRARRLVFSAEGDERLTSAAVTRALGIEVGGDVDLEELAALERTAARDRALRLLGYRDRSGAELIKRLVDDGYPCACVNDLMERFIELDIVDDERFARSWVRTRIASGFGSSRIRRELHDKGVAAETIEAAFAESGDDADEHDRAVALLRGRVPRDRKEKDRLIRRLVSRGFSLSAAIAAVPSPGHDDAEEPEQ